MKHSILIIEILITLGMSSCQAGWKIIKYTSPDAHIFKSDKEKYQIIIDRPFDVVWDQIFIYTTYSYFSIEKIDKLSGLMTLNFGASNPGEFVDCGFVYAIPHYQADREAFNGNYFDFMTRYFKGEFIGIISSVRLFM